MAIVNIYNREGKVAGTMELPAALFDVAVNEALVHEVVVAGESNSRSSIAHTKDRSEVSGGGKKPWKQKGTGRARHGSSRSPIWVGGGVTFGPTSDRNFSKKVNKKAKRKALAMVLSDKVRTNQFLVVESFDLEHAKTKDMSQMLHTLPYFDAHTLLLLAMDEATVIVRASKNLKKTQTLPSTSVNISDLLRAGRVIISRGGVESLVKTYSSLEEAK